MDHWQRISVEAASVEDERPDRDPVCEDMLELPPEPMFSKVELGDVLHEVKFTSLAMKKKNPLVNKSIRWFSMKPNTRVLSVKSPSRPLSHQA